MAGERGDARPVGAAASASSTTSAFSTDWIVLTAIGDSRQTVSHNEQSYHWVIQRRRTAGGPGDSCDERYTLISADCHGGGAIADYRPYLPTRFHDEFDEWAGAYEIEYEDLLGRPRRAQLELEPAPRRHGGRRRRRRGHLSRTRSRRSIRSRRSPSSRRRRPPASREAVGRAAGAQPLARRLLQRGARAGGPASPRSCCTTSRPRSTRFAGPRRPASPAACCCPACRRTAGCPSCTTASTTSRCGRCARSSGCRSTTTAAAPARR